MAIYNIEIRKIQVYQIDGVRAKTEEAAVAKAFVLYQKNPEDFFDDVTEEAEVTET